jgi:hypothetical protein
MLAHTLSLLTRGHRPRLLRQGFMALSTTLEEIQRELMAERAARNAAEARADKDAAARIAAEARAAVDAAARIAAETRSESLLLLREAGGAGAGGAPPLPLVNAEVAPPTLPPPLAFAEALLGGEPMMVANLQSSPGIAAPRPFYLTLPEHSALERFLSRPPTDAPDLLLLVGPIKSGKTRLVHTVIPRLLAARHAAAAALSGAAAPPPPRPAIFSYTFPQGLPAEPAAQHFVEALLAFAALGKPALAGSYLNAMPRLAALAAERVHAGGGAAPWLLLDELGAPIVASTDSDAAFFAQQLKSTVEQCSPFARIVATGSGMVALLASIRATRANGFRLWDAMKLVRLGWEPSAPAALAMAQGLLAAYSRSWPAPAAPPADAARPAITPQCLVRALARGAHNGVTSPRPALVAYLLALVDDALGSGWGGGADALARALAALLRKLEEESLQDAAVGLRRLSASDLRHLRALAAGEAPGPPASFSLAALAALLGEGPAAQPVLLPPYGTLLRSWVTREGRLTVAITSHSQELAACERRNLLAVFSLAPGLLTDTRAAASAAVLRALARNGIGIEQRQGSLLVVRAPRTVEELAGMPAVVGLLGALDEEAALQGESESRSSAKLRTASREAGSPGHDKFMEEAGLTVLAWMRHVQAHVFFPTQHHGFTTGVVGEAVWAAVRVIVEREGGAYELDGESILRVQGAAARRGALTAPRRGGAGPPGAAQGRSHRHRLLPTGRRA